MERIPAPPYSDAARNHIIDLARASSVLMVVLFHSLLFRVEVVDGGAVVTPWEPPAAWWVFSWFVMIVPVFFVSAGFADAIAVDGLNTRGTGLAHFLARRGRRLVGPLVLFVSFVAIVATGAAWGTGPAAPTPYPGSTGLSRLELSTWLSRDFCFFLWFVAIYQLLLLAAPWLVRAQDRAGVLGIVLLGVVVVALDLWSFAAGDPRLRQWNVVLVWTICHQFGIGYHRGWFRTGPLWVPLLTLAGSVATIIALVTVGGYPPSAVAFAEPAVANNLPPTIALAFLGLAQVSLLGLLERSGALRTLGPRSADRLGRLNAMMITVYLWQNACIIVAMQVLVWLSLAWPWVGPHALSPVVVTFCSALILWAFVPWVTRLEHRLTPPLGVAQDLGAAVAASLLLLMGTTLIWLHGAVVHPERPWSSAGVVMIWAGALTMIRAAGGSRRPRRAS